MPAKRGPGRPPGLIYPDRLHMRLPAGMLAELGTVAEGRELTTVALIRQLLRDGLTRERKRVERL